MTIRLLRTLVAIADAKTFSAAAEQVHVTHAAVSQQMQTLEADLGLALFNRTTRTPTLTPVAQQVVTKARKLILDYDNLVPSVLDGNSLSGTISLGAIPTTLTGITPQAVAVLKSKFPQIRLHIRPGLTQPLLAEIERGFLDAAIVSKPHLMPMGLAFRELAREPMQLISAIEECEEDPITLLKNRPFIRFNRNAVVGTLVDNWLAFKRIRVSETMELDSPQAITSMVYENLGVSIVPEMVVKPREDITVKHLDLGPGAPFRTLGLVHLANHIKVQALDELFSALETVIATEQANSDSSAS